MKANSLKRYSCFKRGIFICLLLSANLVYANYKLSISSRQTFYKIAYKDEENQTETSIVGKSVSGIELSDEYAFSSSLSIGLSGFYEKVRFTPPEENTLTSEALDLKGFAIYTSLYRNFFMPKLKLGKESFIFIDPDSVGSDELVIKDRTYIQISLNPRLIKTKRRGFFTRLNLGSYIWFPSKTEEFDIKSATSVYGGVESRYVFKKWSFDFRGEYFIYKQKIEEIQQNNTQIRVFFGVSFGR